MSIVASKPNSDIEHVQRILLFYAHEDNNAVVAKKSVFGDNVMSEKVSKLVFELSFY